MIFLKTFWKRIFLLLLIYSSSRILFYLLNSSSFSENIFLSILEGIRFDISALFYINIPLLILLLFPIESICDLTLFITRKIGRIKRILSPVVKLLEYCKNIKIKIWYQKMTNILFYIINIPFIIINNVDIEYFKFTQKRSSIDIIDLLSLGGGVDTFNFLPQYILDYWHITIITIIQIFLLLKIKSFPKKKLPESMVGSMHNAIANIFGLFFGGLVYSVFSVLYSSFISIFIAITVGQLTKMYIEGKFTSKTENKITKKIIILLSNCLNIFFIRMLFIGLVYAGFACVFILGARGGTQLKPIKPINAGIFSNTQNSALILNTPFCILHSYFSKGLEKHNYFTKEEANKIYTTIHKFEDKFKKKNIVIIILESFSKEYVGYYNEGNGYTPFLDSIIQHSLVMENGYANGVKSIEAVPSIVSSVPTLMNEPFITSPYSTNSFNSIASLLKKEGYSASFFHGGARGTMGFYSYTQKAGFNNYFGIEEFLHDGGKEEDDDKVWGAYDGPFLKYFSEYLKKEQEPFVTTFFSITSHPPFTLPEEFENTFPKGNNGYHETVGYTDQMLKEFFERSKKEEWYKNTLFVIAADHTSGANTDSKYKNRVGRYSIPIIYFMGDSSLKGSNTTITQQIDIMPTTLDILNYNKEFFSFGKSIYGKSISSDESWAISNLYYGEHLLTHEEGFLRGREDEYTNFSDKNFKEETKINEDAIRLLKAIKQKYSNSLLDNKMNINED